METEGYLKIRSSNEGRKISSSVLSHGYQLKLLGKLTCSESMVFSLHEKEIRPEFLIQLSACYYLRFLKK